jgi:16S rRNA (adenine1518-N6/adenine1519-N6)-dimethyltransferase
MPTPSSAGSGAAVVRLGQNFLADPNLLDAIVRDAGLSPADVVLEVGAGEGVLTERLAAVAAHVHSVEIDRSLEPALATLAARPDVDLHWGDAMKLDLAAFRPAPTAMVANLPYAVATPLILTTIADLPTVGRWTVMVQREIADRLRAGPGSRTYGSPSAVAQLACEVELVRKVDPAVFRPRPRVDSAILRLTRRGPGADPATRELIRAAFAHRRKSLARSLEHVAPGRLAAARAGLAALGLPEDARAESLAPGEFAALAAKLAETTPVDGPKTSAIWTDAAHRPPPEETGGAPTDGD